MSINLTQGLFDIEATHIALVSPPVESLTFFPNCLSGFWIQREGLPSGSWRWCWSLIPQTAFHVAAS